MRSNLISKVILFVAIHLVAAGSWAQNVNSECASITTLKEAESCFVAIAEDMGSENDPNAVLVTDSKEAKSLLLEILKNQNMKQDVAAVKNADYVAVIVENNDEAYLHYYVANKGALSFKEVGYAINTADLVYEFCPRTELSLPAKFAKVQNLLLGMNPKATIAGTVWLQDFTCEE